MHRARFSVKSRSVGLMPNRHPPKKSCLTRFQNHPCRLRTMDTSNLREGPQNRCLRRYRYRDRLHWDGTHNRTARKHIRSFLSLLPNGDRDFSEPPWPLLKTSVVYNIAIQAFCQGGNRLFLKFSYVDKIRQAYRRYFSTISQNRRLSSAALRATRAGSKSPVRISCPRRRARPFCFISNSGYFLK